MLEVKEALGVAPDAWINEFLDCGGLTALCLAMASAQEKARLAPKDVDAAVVEEEMVEVFGTLMQTRAGLSAFLGEPPFRFAGVCG